MLVCCLVVLAALSSGFEMVLSPFERVRGMFIIFRYSKYSCLRFRRKVFFGECFETLPEITYVIEFENIPFRIFQVILLENR